MVAASISTFVICFAAISGMVLATTPGARLGTLASTTRDRTAGTERSEADLGCKVALCN